MHARAAWLLLILATAGCSKKSASVGAPSPSAEPPTASEGAGAPAPAPPAFAPDEIWIHRTIELGSTHPLATLTVATLSRDHAHARLVIEKRQAPYTGRQAADLAWQTSEVHHYDGDVVVDTHARLELRLVDTDTHMPLPFACSHASRTIAPPTATRIRDAGFKGTCGDKGVWSMPATTRVDVLACGTPEQPDDYRLAPGLETVSVLEDCYLQGKADRLIGDDGAITPTGSPHL